MHACFGRAVDVISSSPYLAQRDAEKYAAFFKRFDINVSCISNDAPSDGAFFGQILYGTNYDFEFAWMRDQLSPKQRRVTQLAGQSAPRPFQVAVIEEVDNLLIDWAIHSARIAISAIQKTEWVYPLILEFVQTHKVQIEAASSPLLWQEILTDLRSTCFEQGRDQKEVAAFTDKKLIRWIKSAHSALYLLKENQEYTIQYLTRIRD